MNLPDTIYAHARVLPADLQRETLDFISYLEQRYRITPPSRVVCPPKHLSSILPVAWAMIFPMT